MSGDCPHDLHERPLALSERSTSPLRFSLWDRSALIATHDNYMSLISELKSELGSLSSQVALVQQELRNSDQHDGDRGQLLETSLRALESQNDLLQHALEHVSKESKKTCAELSKSVSSQNESLQCQVEHLQCTIIEKEECISQLNAMIQQLQCDTKHNADRCLQSKDQELQDVCLKLEQATRRVEALSCELDRSQKQERFLLCETRKLNEELNESRRKHGELNVQVHRLATLLKKQDNCRTDICSKYEDMEQNYEEQSKQLRAACAQLNCLQERLAVMEKRQEEHNMERNLLREEVLALKEKEANMLNRHKCLSEQLLKTEKELYTAHDVIREQQTIMQRNDCTQRDCVKRLQDANADLKHQFSVICEDYKRLEEEYKKQCELRKQNEKVIESFRKWKEAQLKADDATRASFKQYEDHIKLLLEEKQKFLEQYRELHRDYCTLQNELERIKVCSYGSGAGSNQSENSITHRMELIRRASRRLAQQSSSLKCDDSSQDASGSKSLQELK